MNNRINEYLNKCSRMYYSGEPIISDDVFDALAHSVGYSKVGYKLEINKEKHIYPMYSLQKFYEDEGTERPIAGYKDITGSPKLDGAALALLYIDGVLARALTRGDGIEGLVVTDKFVTAGNALIPQVINLPGVVQITGELVAPKEIENSRNYAAGSLALKSVEEFLTREVAFFAYGIQPYVNARFPDDMKLLKQQGFNTIYDEDIHNIYPCDGMVFRVNSYDKFTELGYTAKHPRGAYALKERGAPVETTILDVEWNTGKSGKVTPVAILDPIKIGDKKVSRATLNNIGFIRALDLHIGDKVGIILGGEIIPKVTHKVD